MMRNLTAKKQRKSKERERFASDSFPTLATLRVRAKVHLFSYVESTAVGLRMEPAAAKGFPQDGIVRLLQTLERCDVSSDLFNQGWGHGANRKCRGIAETDDIYLGLLVETRQIPS